MAHDSILCVPDASQNPIILNLNFARIHKIKVISMAHDSILCVPDASQNPIILNLNFARIQARNLNIEKIISSELIITQK